MSEILISPFSNSFIRDWPARHFSALAGILAERLPDDVAIRITGAANQRLRARDIVRPHRADRVFNECGRISWPDLMTRLRGAACIVSNNSGIGHLGGYFGVPTVCVFGGSHQRREWRPLGRSVVTVSRVIGCSPCQLDHGGASPYAKACLREIDPETVAEAVFTAMQRSPEPLS